MFDFGYRNASVPSGYPRALNQIKQHLFLNHAKMSVVLHTFQEFIDVAQVPLPPFAILLVKLAVITVVFRQSSAIILEVFLIFLI